MLDLVQVMCASSNSDCLYGLKQPQQTHANISKPYRIFHCRDANSLGFTIKKKNNFYSNGWESSSMMKTNLPNRAEPETLLGRSHH